MTDYNVRNDDVIARGLQKLEEITNDDMSFQAFPENSQWCRRREVLRQRPAECSAAG